MLNSLFTPAEMAALRAVNWPKLAQLIEDSGYTADQMLSALLLEIAALNGCMPEMVADDTRADDVAAGSVH